MKWYLIFYEISIIDRWIIIIPIHDTTDHHYHSIMYLLIVLYDDEKDTTESSFDGTPTSFISPFPFLLPFFLLLAFNFPIVHVRIVPIRERQLRRIDPKNFIDLKKKKINKRIEKKKEKKKRDTKMSENWVLWNEISCDKEFHSRRNWIANIYYVLIQIYIIYIYYTIQKNIYYII